MFNQKKLIKNVLLPNKGKQKQFKGRGPTENRAVDCAATMDQTDHQPRNHLRD